VLAVEQRGDGEERQEAGQVGAATAHEDLPASERHAGGELAEHHLVHDGAFSRDAGGAAALAHAHPEAARNRAHHVAR